MQALPASISELKIYELVYLATPYRKFSLGLPLAAKQAAKVAGRLAIEGVRIFAPIPHSHMIAIYGGIIPTANEFWCNFNKRFLDVCDALVIAKMEGWEQSDGIKWEIEEFQKQAKPIYYLDPKTLALAA